MRKVRHRPKGDDRHPLEQRPGRAAVYALELVGETDAFARYEAAALTPGVRLIAPGVALANARPTPPDRLAYTRTVSRVVARSPAEIDRAASALEAASIDRDGSAAVRARAVRGTPVETQEVERRLGSVLVDRGFAIDLENPDHTLRAIFSGRRAVLGWIVDEPDHGFVDRQPTNRPFFQPGSMSPRLALALVNIAVGDRPGRVLDPMCGTGGSLIEAGRVGLDVIGLDVQARMVAGARRNTDRYVDGKVAFVLGDATRLPLRSGSIDAVVFDVPYGRQSKIAGTDARSLVAGVLAEAGRVSDRAVVVADRSLGPLARAAGWKVRAEFAQRVHRSLTRHIHDLYRSG